MIKNNFNKIIYILIILAAVIVGWGVSKLLSDDKASNQINNSFNLLNDDGLILSSDDLNEKSKVIFFGFTNCPDVCPISVDLMTASIDIIKNENQSLDQVEFLFITTDPKRDTPERLKEFLSGFSPKIIGLTGEYAELKKVWKNFFVHVLPAKGQSVEKGNDHSDHGDENYMVEHTAFFYLFNNQDQLSAILPFGTSEEVLLTEIKKIL